MRFTDKVYSALKFIALVLLPAIASAYFALANIWHLHETEEIIGTISVVDTLLGALLHVSTKTYNNSDEKYDGTFGVVQNPDGSQILKLLSIDLDAINNGTKKELVFQVQPGVIKQVPSESTPTG